jgi:hypothetical protein
MSDIIQKQKDMYKNHLEFLGYSIENHPDDEQRMTIIRDNVRTFIKVFNSGLRSMLVYGISDNAKKNRLPFLEFINECNDKRVAKISVTNDSLIIEMWYFCPYEKISFGEFMKLFDDEAQKILNVSNEKDFLA